MGNSSMCVGEIVQFYISYKGKEHVSYRRKSKTSLVTHYYSTISSDRNKKI